MPTARRGEVLPLAVLGLLHDSPMHGYELRKQLSNVLGVFRALSYGSLYPCLRSMESGGLIAADGGGAEAGSGGRTGKRGRIVYRITADGKERLQEMLTEAGPTAWEDEAFGVHFALFAQTDAATRLRILEGRRSRLEERLGGLRGALARTRERLDSYTLELQRHGLESVEREVRWLNEVIATERSGTAGPTTGPTAKPPPTPPTPTEFTTERPGGAPQQPHTTSPQPHHHRRSSA